MRDEQYAPEEVGHYPLVEAQPVVARRMRPHLRATAAGTALAVVSLVCAAVAPVLRDTWDASWLWPGIGIGAAVLMVLICFLQLYLWAEAMQEWTGRKDVDLSAFRAPSWAAHVVSYLAAVAGLWAFLSSASPLGPGRAAFWVWVLGAVCLVLAQVLAGVQYIREGGAPGTLPAHIRRLVRDGSDRR